jgi:hypothetical protein
MTFHPLIHLFFDLTANDGWNGVALATYTMMIILIIGMINEKRKGQ